LTLDQAQWEAAGRRLPLNDVNMLDLTKQARQDKEGRNGTWWLCFVVKRFIEWRRKGGGGKGSKVASDVPVAVQEGDAAELGNQNSFSKSTST